MVGIHAWVAPASQAENELIVGRVVHVPPSGDDVRVAWLSNERGLWLNYEYKGDLIVIPVPEIGIIEALMVTAVPTTPWDYD